MSTIKRKFAIWAAALVLTLTGVLGLAVAGAVPAGAGTPSCGAQCLNVFNKNFGTFHNPQFVMDVFQQKRAVGQPVILFREANSDPAEDFTIGFDGTVADFYTAGLVTSTLALHYGCNNAGFLAGNLAIPCDINPLTGKPSSVNDYAFEVEYAPYGVDSGLCAGTASVAGNGTLVSLQPCGVSARTVWIADTLDSCPGNPLYSGELPAINGSSTNFSHPAVLTYPSGGYPTDKPRPQLLTEELTGFSQTGGVTPPTVACGGSAITGPDNNQLWSATLGVLP